jgi:hypothetical protein
LAAPEGGAHRGKLYKWTTTGLVACFLNFMACLLARQEGSKRKPTKDDRYRQLNMARNCPRKQLFFTREANPTFFNAVIQRSWQSLFCSSLIRHGEVCPVPSKTVNQTTGSGKVDPILSIQMCQL